MSAKVHKMMFHWTSLLMQSGFICAPVIVNLRRNKLNHGFYLRKMVPADLPNMPDEHLLDLVETEMCSKSEERLYPFEKADFGIKVQDDIDSATYGFFFCQNGVTFRFPTRLALNDVETIRRHYPNLLRLFKEGFARKWVKDFKSVKDNFRSAKGIRDLLMVLREKDLSQLKIDTSSLSDEDLKKVLLTPNAKKFAFGRELLIADSFYHALPGLYSFVSFALGWTFFNFLKQKMVERYAIAIAFLLSVFLFCLLDRIDQINEATKFDRECMELGDDYLAGGKEYIQSSIELGKLLYRLTDGKALFDSDGNYTRHKVKYTERMQAAEETEQRLLKEDKKKRKDANKFKKMISE